jgi:hypothetical protein
VVVRIAKIKSVCDEEVELESFLGIGGAVEHGEFVVSMGDDFLFVVCRFLVLLK